MSYNISVLSYTYTVAKMLIDTPDEFSKIVLYSTYNDDNIIYIDELIYGNESSKLKSLSFDDANKILKIDTNYIDVHSIFYGSFFVLFLDSDGVEIGRTNYVQVRPAENTKFSGAVKKLEHDFSIVVRTSGTTMILFVVDKSSTHCPDCWDFELEQRTKTVCSTCDSTGYLSGIDMIKFKARRIKTKRSSIHTESGILDDDTVVYQTYSRLPFQKEHAIYDTTTGEFFLIKQTNIASIGGIRTSTNIIAEKQPEDDGMIKKYSRLIV